MTVFRAEADMNVAVAEEIEPLMERPRTVWRDAWTRIRRSRSAIVCLVVLGIYAAIALVGFTGALNRAIEVTVGPESSPPSLASISRWVGTDFLGRSVLWRLLYGARVAMIVAVLSAVISSLIGTLLGLASGYFGGWVDSLVVWLFSTISSIPGILLIMALAFVLKGQEIVLLGHHLPLTGIPAIVLAMGLTSWVGLCRYIRGESLKLREQDYVVAARATGVRHWRILIRHILPNVFHLIIIDFSLGLAAFVQMEVVLSFLGLGVTDQPSWGRMIDDAKLELLKGVWWQMAAATVAIFVFSLAVNILGDVMRDALDPRLRGVD
jgi:peptide/nickel transport system permease protein